MFVLSHSDQKTANIHRIFFFSLITCITLSIDFGFWFNYKCRLVPFCYTFLYVHSRFAIILMGKRELVALLSLSSWCLAIVVWLFLAVP